MQLQAWLTKEDISVSVFARRIDVSFQTVWRWLYRGRTPKKDMRKRVFEATRGEVKPADWFNDE